MILGIFEALMLVCFATSWPFSLVKAYRARTNRSSSLLFMGIVFIGYMFGIANKLVNDDITYVLAFYILDSGLVATGLLIYLRNSRLEKNASCANRPF